MLFRASIDLKQFYPNIRLATVMDGLTSTTNIDENMRKLLHGMLSFRLDTSGTSAGALENAEPLYDNLHLIGIPTGLFVAGFLANVAMLVVDTEIDRRIIQKRSIAHFRFVDDHTVLSYDFDDLCDWIESYRQILRSSKIGVDVNAEKFDPSSLGNWMASKSKIPITDSAKARISGEAEGELRATAMSDARFDGRNPTELLTKTLGQISIIATTDVHTLDDRDLDERLKLLEWLLLANIPEREIRGDTRASFAAGKIASLAPMLVRDVKGLVDASREVLRLRACVPDPKTASREEVAQHTSIIETKALELTKREDELRKSEEYHLRHCFDLLLQAFREYPAKPSLFYRMHQYCRLTGFHGLKQIRKWIQEVRQDGNESWADYYLGLSHQLVARGTLLASRTYMLYDALRSERQAAFKFLEDVSKIDPSKFRVKHESESWFHAMSRKHLGVALLAVAQTLAETSSTRKLAKKLGEAGYQYCGVSFDDSSAIWMDQTGYSPPVWAQMCESSLSIDDNCTASWISFMKIFSPSDPDAACAVRRYPEMLPNAFWTKLLHGKDVMPRSDAGFLRDAMRGDNERIDQARLSKKDAFGCAVRSLESTPTRWITLSEWTRFIAEDLSAFDPRGSEWTALEIVRQIVSPIVDDIDTHESMLDRVHPENVLLPISWKTTYDRDVNESCVSWQDWQAFATTTVKRSDRIKIKASRSSIVDYRYFVRTRLGMPMQQWERRLVGVGRLLLGQLRRNYDTPRIWNIRGNERIVSLPQSGWLHALSISSPTLVLLNACLSGRVAETRAVKLYPELFGWSADVDLNDIGFDPPLLLGSNDLLRAIQNAQQVLVDNQLAVAMSRPRQLIPFRLRDFSALPYQSEEVESHDA